MKPEVVVIEAVEVVINGEAKVKAAPLEMYSLWK